MAKANVAIVCNDYTGTNTIKIALFRQSDPLTQVAADFHAGPFSQAVFNFFGLDRVTHFRRLYEVANDDFDHVLATYGDRFFFIPNNQQDEVKVAVEWTAGVDYMPDGTQYPAGVSSFSNTDWVGWEIETFTQFENEFTGNQYLNDVTIGALSFTEEGAVFELNARYKVTFKPHVSIQEDNNGGGYMSGKKYVTTDTTLTAADAGKKILCKGASRFYTITLPPLATMPELVPFFIEVPPSVDTRSVRIVSEAGKIIDFGKGNASHIWLKNSESLEIYKEADDIDVNNVVLMWRVAHPFGNHTTVGEFIPEYAASDDVVNKLPLDGGGASGIDAFIEGRLYDYVLSLDASKVVSYAAWVNDRTKFSYKHPITNRFQIPDLRGLYIRMSSSALPAAMYLPNAMIDHEHPTNTGELPSNLSQYGTISPAKNIGKYFGTEIHKPDLTGLPYVKGGPGGWKQQDTSTETRPETIVTNGYIRT
jgi:hypothetical protein